MESSAKTRERGEGRRPVRALLAPSLAAMLALCSGVSVGGEPAPALKASPVKPATRQAAAPASRPARRNLKLPGLVVNFEERCVDLQAAVCLEEGLLELIACTKGTKEHESIVTVTARPMHIHAALLLLGANPGNPAMRKPLDEEGSRWIHIPPRGDRVEVYLVFKNRQGKTVERSISDFVARSARGPDGQVAAGAGDADGEAKFPHTFLFAGSHLRDNPTGPRTYLCDVSGHVITISTFGDELLCLPGVHGQQDASLVWQVDSTHLPKVGTKVTLRLRPQVRPARKAGKTAPAGGTRQMSGKKRQQ